MLKRLWSDEAGFIVSAELVLVATIVVISMVVGLTCIRNQVVQELIDVGQALGNISQTYGYNGIDAVHVGNSAYYHGWAYCSGSAYWDVVDYCQDTNVQTPGHPSGGITFTDLPNPLPSLTGEEITGNGG